MEWSRLPPLSMLRAFEAAARLGGYSAAGRELNVTHAAVAQQVRALEERLGVALMRRDGRAVRPSPEGRALAEGLGAGLETMRAALAELARDAAARPVRVTLTPSFAAAWLAPRIGGFALAHPEVELVLNPTSAVVDLARSEDDVAIRFGSGSWPGLEATPLVRSAVVVVAAPSLLAGREIAAPEQLLEMPWIQEAGSHEWRVWLSARGVTIPPEKRDILHAPGFIALQALRAGHGVGMTARVWVAEDIAAGRLTPLFDADGDDAAETGYHVVRRPGAMRPGVAAFAAWLEREARAPEAWPV